jgi:hypothetical protein
MGVTGCQCATVAKRNFAQAIVEWLTHHSGIAAPSCPGTRAALLLADRSIVTRRTLVVSPLWSEVQSTAAIRQVLAEKYQPPGFSVVYSIEIGDVFDKDDPSGQQAQDDDRQGLAQQP